MDLIVSWALLPALLFALFTGCGLLVELAGGRTLPASLLPAAGLAATIVAGTALTVADRTAELAAPLCAALAVAGLLGAALRRRALPRAAWAAGAAFAAFAVYAAPIVLSGEATIAGYVKLDDTATWLAFADRIADHGRDLDGLPPSTYEATLALNVGEGYPLGAFVPLAIGATLSGVDPAWLVQPYMATLGAVLALALWALATPLAARPGLRLAASVVGAVPALLFGYYLWGGVKEVLAAALLAALVALSISALERTARAVLAPALAAAALVAALSGAGAIWLIAPLVGLGAVIVARLGPRAAAPRIGLAAAIVVVCSLPTLIPGGLTPPTSSPLDDAGAHGNLAGPLDPFQLAGIWGSGDFRFAPGDELATLLLAGLACALALGGIVWAVRRGIAGMPIFAGTALVGCAALALAGSPWVEAKAFATASVAIPFAAMVAAGLVVNGGRAVLGGVAALLVAGGVLWSNALAYLDVNLAPRAQLEELARIGGLVDGKGPTLVTEYSPYGARHFLRDGDPESISELRRRQISLRDGTEVPKGESADTDRIDPGALSVYRSLVVRRSPAASRPPSAYELVWAGEAYELWQRAAGARAATKRIGLGDRRDPVGVPACERVRRLAAGAPPGATVIAARQAAPVVVAVSDAGYPDVWGPPDAARPVTAGTLEAELELARPGEYELWLGGSVRPRVEARIDGRTVGVRRHELNNGGGFVSFGVAGLDAGTHRVELEFGGTDLAPGSDGSPDPVGPLALSSGGAARASLVRTRPEAARRLCGEVWDWIEVVGGAGARRIGPGPPGT